MAFQFSLEMVLRVRQIAEDHEERALGQIHQVIAETRQTISSLELLRDELISFREAEICRRISAAELQLFYQRARSIDEEIQQLTAKLGELDQMRLRQLVVYQAAHHNRELLDGVRTDQKEIHQRNRLRKEQKVLDDNFSSRRSGQKLC